MEHYKNKITPIMSYDNTKKKREKELKRQEKAHIDNILLMSELANGTTLQKKWTRRSYSDSENEMCERTVSLILFNQSQSQPVRDDFKMEYDPLTQSFDIHVRKELQDKASEHFTKKIRSHCQDFCMTCGKASTLQCSKCRTVIFCSKECINAMWSTHKKFCKCIVLAQNYERLKNEQH